MSRISGLTDSLSFQVFMGRVQEKREEWERILRDSLDREMIFRAQGAVVSLEFVEGLIEAMEAEEEMEKRQEKAEAEDSEDVY
ncbi:MAG: hypothetical protein M1353_12505 [Nitrospirae bacterium]|nr:hypothetical protein [Nitrospirota bacterium]